MPAGNAAAAAAQLASLGYCALAPVQLFFMFAQYFSVGVIGLPEELLELLELLTSPELDDEPEPVVLPLVSVSSQPMASKEETEMREATRRMLVLVIRASSHDYASDVKSKCNRKFISHFSAL